MNRVSYLLFAFLIIPTLAWAKLRLPAVFSDGMILQQQSEVIFWGWASPGEKISLIPGWTNHATNIQADERGQWKAKIKTAKAGGPYTISFKAENNIEIKDVLLGEVWVCSGQSNMVFSLKGSAGAKEEIAGANYPNIRYFSVKRQYGLNDFEDCAGSVWEKTTPASAGSFSAVAYYFAKKIQQERNVPVGIIYSAWGGTPAEAWTPQDVLNGDSILHQYIDRWDDIQKNVGKDSAEYHIALDEWAKSRSTADSNKVKKPAEPQTLYYFKRPWREPSVLFNGMIEPVIPYAIKGVLWYQGESNVAYADEYAHLLGDMIQSWRARWKASGYSSVLPFYFVQIASYGYSDLNKAAILRDGQKDVANTIPNTGMAVTIDVGDMKDIHFTRKKEVGERLALVALAKTYANSKTIYKGPVVKRASIEDKNVVLTYEGSSLVAGDNNPSGFEIGYAVPGTDSIRFVGAKAMIKDNRVVVYNETGARPVAVRYAWLLCGEANLFNKEGLPAEPFTKKLKREN